MAQMRRNRHLTAVVIAVLVVAGCSWTQSRFDPARTAHNPVSGISSRTIGTLRPAWSVPNTYLFPGAGLVADGVVVTAYAGRVDAYAADDGSPLWAADLGPVAIVGDTLYSTTTSDPVSLVALDLHTGVRRWSTTAGGVVSSADEDSVYLSRGVGGGHGEPYYSVLDVWDVRSHRLRWSEQFAGEPAIAGGVVYTYDLFRNADPRVEELVAADASTGKRIWSAPMTPACPSDGTAPVVSGDNVYFGGQTRRRSDGALVRTWPVCPPFTDVAVDGTTVFASVGASDATSRLTAFDGVTGAVRWSAAGAGPPTIADDLVIVHTDAAVVAYAESTGRPVWFTGLDPLGYAVAADGLLLVSTDIPGPALQVFRTNPS
jgi:outer membrane protein assembly factor BamB